MNQTQGLGNVSYSLAHEEILEKCDRERVATQIETLIKVHLNTKSLKNKTVLDVGCASGIITRHLSHGFKKTIGIDVDNNAIRIASKKYSGIKNLSFKLAGGEKLPFRNGFFDIVLCNQVYSYASNPNKMMSEIYRVLKTDGICIFTGDNVLRLVEPLYNLPLIRFIPKPTAKWILKITGHHNIYIGNYKNYWQLKELCKKFNLWDYTLKILIQPKKYKFIKLIKYQKITARIPIFLLKIIEPFLPTFIFILKKV